MALRLRDVLRERAAVASTAKSRTATVPVAARSAVHRLRQGLRPGHRLNVWQVELERI